MLDTPLVQTFRTLTKTERRAFGKWIASPFFNQRPDVLHLYEYLCEQVPVGQAARSDAAAISKVSAFSRVFPSDGRRSARAYSDADMRHAMSFLFQALKEFLAYQHWSEDGADTGRHLCKSLRRRGLEQVFEKEFSALSSRLTDSAHRSADYFFQQYHLHLERWEVFRRSSREASDVLQQAGVARDAYIAAETLRHACAVMAQPGERGAMNSSVYLEATLAAVEAGAFEAMPAVMAYFHCFRLLSEPEAEADFQRLRVLLVEHWALFPVNEIRDLYVGAINYCIRRLNSGVRGYIREALNLYRSGLERGVILEDGFLNKYTYNNILLLAVALEEWDWSFRFLEQYKSALPPRDRDSAWRYNLATYYFRKKEFEQAQEILSQVEFRDVFYHLDARRMLVRIYFNTDATAALESLLDSFTIYLQRKRSALGYHRELNLNFVRFVKRLLQLEPGNVAARERIAAKIQETRLVAEREWLLAVCT